MPSQARAKAKTGDAIAALLNLTPKTALLLDESAHGLAGIDAGAPGIAADSSSRVVGKQTAADVAADAGLLGAAKVREVPLELVQVCALTGCGPAALLRQGSHAHVQQDTPVVRYVHL